MTDSKIDATPRQADYESTLLVNASPDRVFDALSTTSGLSAWWTRADGSGETGGELRFFFTFPEPCVMRVDEAVRPALVRWTVVECDFLRDWVGTRPTFTIREGHEGTTEIHFRHEGLTAELDCIEMCTRGDLSM